MVGVEAYQFDAALALKYHYLDEDNLEMRYRGILGVLMNIGRALKVKFKRLPDYEPKFPKRIITKENLTKEDLMKMWGENGFRNR